MFLQYYSFKRRNLWARAAGKVLWLVLFFLLTSGVSTSALASVLNKKLHFEWEYDINLPELAGYIIYQNNQHLFTINDPATLTIDYDIELETNQTTIFTMKAFDVDGNESALSAPYIIYAQGSAAATQNAIYLLLSKK